MTSAVKKLALYLKKHGGEKSMIRNGESIDSALHHCARGSQREEVNPKNRLLHTQRHPRWWLTCEASRCREQGAPGGPAQQPGWVNAVARHLAQRPFSNAHPTQKARPLCCHLGGQNTAMLGLTLNRGQEVALKGDRHCWAADFSTLCSTR